MKKTIYFILSIFYVVVPAIRQRGGIPRGAIQQTQPLKHNILQRRLNLF